MSVANRAFFDTNVLLYLFSADTAKANRAEAVLARGGTVSVQVLNECAAVASRKLRMPMGEIREFLSPIAALCTVESVTLETHRRALELSERRGWSIYDATIVASALLAGCDTLYSEDFHDGEYVDGVTIRNPFAER